MKGSTTKIIAASGVLFLGLLFQNCSNSQFTSDENALALKAEGSESLVSIEETANGDVPNADEADVAVVGDQEEDKKGGKKESNEKDKECDRKYVCVIEDAGNSLKVAYINDQLATKVGTPSDVCMTQEACTQIVGQVMKVKGAYRRGFCPDKNPHVVNFSNARVQELVNKLK